VTADFKPFVALDDDEATKAQGELDASKKQAGDLQSESDALQNDRAKADAAGDKDAVAGYDSMLRDNESKLVALNDKIDQATEFLKNRPKQIDIGPQSGGGREDYYRQRQADFTARNPGGTAPSYYLGYGDKYLQRFTNELRPKLSMMGKGWATLTRWELQSALEGKVKADPEGFASLERDSSAFQAFAFDTHPEAYLNGGISELPMSDRLQIITTPDPGDLMTWGGVKQVVETGSTVVGEDLLRAGALNMGWPFSGPEPGVMWNAASEGGK
jgi:hypothetical protein